MTDEITQRPEVIEHDVRTRDARRVSFDRNAALYDRVRPSYPEGLVDAVIAHAPGKRALEIGAGTGKATAVFARRDLSITALEPGAAMATLLRANAPSVTVVESTFEAFDTPDRFDLVYAAQAFHWVDEATGYAHAARLGRVLAVITNEKRHLEPGLRAELDRAYERHFPLAWERGSDAPRNSTRSHWIEKLDRSGAFEPVLVIEEPWDAHYSTQQYLDLLSTYSDHAVHEDPRPLYDAIRAAIDRRGGTIHIPYLTMAFVAKSRTADR
jgi:SAM-dependent methyltransferase